MGLKSGAFHGPRRTHHVIEAKAVGVWLLDSVAGVQE